MTPFPTSDKLTFLLQGDAWITQIILNAHTLTFRMANGCRIESAQTLIYVAEDGSHTVHNKPWRDEQPVRFHNLLEKPLLGVTTSGLLMSLSFEGGHQLIITSDPAPYEAGAVLDPDGNGFYF